jgi:hypothetical protein
MPTVIGQRYGKLTATKQTFATRGITYWEVTCDCGKTIEVAGRLLTQGRKTSCGCAPEQYCGTKLKPGMKINRLTMVSYIDGEWICRCDCGEMTKVPTNNILNGNTKSCGCLQLEAVRVALVSIHEGNRKLEPRLATAKKRWNDIRYTRDKDEGFITFEQFFDLTSKNCTYCGIEPCQTWNAFAKKKNASQFSRDNGTWTYNGIDRIDSNVGYLIENCCTACFQCNNAKSNQTREDFLARVPKYTTKPFTPLAWEEMAKPEGSLGLSVWMAYKGHYQDGDITLENFYWASSLPCFYCGDTLTGLCNFSAYNKRNPEKYVAEGNFRYNGLDRIDNSRGHYKDNVVVCCQYCNWAKLEQSLEDFQTWMKRIQSFQIAKPTPKSAAILI